MSSNNPSHPTFGSSEDAEGAYEETVPTLDEAVEGLLEYLGGEVGDCDICGNDVEIEGHAEGTHCWNLWSAWRLREKALGHE